jgi:hypothetical protein
MASEEQILQLPNESRNFALHMLTILTILTR